jgi:hypothetical protein
MFDLEQSITEWRKQMHAAGIMAPAQLMELENHLREEIERQIKLGATLRIAFEKSSAIIGEPVRLNSEFKKIRVPQSWQILAVLWFAACLLSLNTVCSRGVSGYALSPGSPTPFIFNSLAWFIYAAGLFGSLLLFRGSKYGVSTIRIIALLVLIACIAEIPVNHNAPAWQIWCGLCALFSAASIWLLHSSKKFKTIA